MSRRLPSTCSGFALLGVALILAGCAAGGKNLDPRSPSFAPLVFEPPEPQRSSLSGGASVFLLPDHDVPLVRVYLAFRGGAVYDPADKAGLSQVARHAWRTGGTQKLAPETLDEELESRGIELDLSLGRERGWVSLSALTPDLPKALDLLAQLLFEPAFEPGRVAWAVSQVEEGIRRESDDPGSLAYRELRRALYRGHPRGVVATLDSVGRVTREDVVALQRRLIEEGAWVLGAVGDFEPEKLLASLEAHFGRLPGEGAAFRPLPRPSEPSPRVVLVPKPLAQSTLLWARLGPERLSPDFYGLELADHILGAGGFQSRLVRDIRSDRGLAYSVGSFYDAYPEFGVLGAHASTKKASTTEVLDLLHALLQKAADGGFTAGEAAQAREALKNRHVFRYEDPANLVREEMDLLLEGLPLDLPRTYLTKISSTEAGEASRAAAAHYRRGRDVTVVVGDLDPEDPYWKIGPPAEVVRFP